MLTTEQFIIIYLTLFQGADSRETRPLLLAVRPSALTTTTVAKTSPALVMPFSKLFIMSTQKKIILTWDNDFFVIQEERLKSHIILLSGEPNGKEIKHVLQGALGTKRDELKN